LQSVNW